MAYLLYTLLAVGFNPEYYGNKIGKLQQLDGL